MIEITRRLAARFRAMLRRSVVDRTPRGEWPLMACRTDAQGLHLYAQRDSVGLRFDVPGKRPPAVLAFRSSELAQFEGRSDDCVVLEGIGPAKGRARWHEGPMPCGVEFETVAPESAAAAPQMPSRWVDQPARFVSALDEAARAAAKESIRFALSHLHWRGSTGELIATDGRQLLVQSGFAFPWKNDVLLPAVRAFGLRELAAEGPVAVGRVGQRVFVRIGPWTFDLEVQEGRFPNVHQVVPRPETIMSRMKFDRDDVVFLLESLATAPGRADEEFPVTLEFGSPPIFRARGTDVNAAAEIEVSRSVCQGRPARVPIGGSYLSRALRLGCNELAVSKPDAPLLFQGDGCTYVVMPLNPELAIAPAEGATHIASAIDVADRLQPRTRRTPMPPSHANGHAGSNGTGAAADAERGPGFQELLVEADQLRAQVQDVLARLTKLLAGLKQFRRQGRAVQAAVQSIRDLRLEG
ncbi:MAG TPA: hypothetical protein VHR72_00050 [Gemmataceae bacterium]|nr:hypothetical protein [Gemmataceae bacterium]